MALMENPVSRIRIINSDLNSCQFFLCVLHPDRFLDDSDSQLSSLGAYYDSGRFFWLLNGFKSRQEIGALMVGLAP
jgi:hypothetical protein